MIGKPEILLRALEWNLRPEVVEKDYVLGWLLAAIGAHPVAGREWVFKGGTCLKKCFFETYRFSEDLDFTLVAGAVATEAGLAAILGEIAQAAHAASGVEFPPETIVMREHPDRRGVQAFEGRLGYRGPLVIPTTPRVRFDLTPHELVLARPQRRRILHPYPDPLPDGAGVLTYPIEELLAEKVRALHERTRPRDLYDVVHILEHQAAEVDLAQVRDLWVRKCRAKGFEAPALGALGAQVRGSAELRAEWENMLGHQLPQMPPIETFFERFESLLAWLEKPTVVPVSALAPSSAEGEVVAPLGLDVWGCDTPLEVVRFAGVNRLMIEFTYSDRSRVAEPYSLRRSSTGKLLLYAFDTAAGAIRAFDVTKISDLRVSRQAFTPRWRVEFVPTGALGAPLAGGVAGGLVRAATPPRRPSGGRSGLVYVYRCSMCGREFPHATRTPTLRPHHDPAGRDCRGRRGLFQRTEYGA